MANLGNRIVVLIDMDCFFCQVETRLNPEFAGKPLAVVQYNQWKLGGIIAVNYEARAFGVTRHMRGDEAREKCPALLLASVPCLRGKADTSKYRSAGREVIEVLKKNCSIVERASVDEAYLDITQIVDDKLNEGIDDTDILKQLSNTFIVGYSESGVNDEEQRSKGVKTWFSEASDDIQIQRLAVAGAFVEFLRKEILESTGFECSAGISFNKILAKLACGLHKPNYQTILPASTVPDLFGTLPIKKVRNLGGKLGDIVIDSLKCNVMSDLLRYSLQNLQNRFDEKTGHWLYNIARGIDNEPVTPRLVSKSIGACKKFPGKQAIVDIKVLEHWLGELSAEICERLEQDFEENERKASLLTVSFQFYQNKSCISQSKSCALTSYKVEKVTAQCLSIVIKATHQLPISFLGLSAGKFIKAKGSENFKNFFKTADKLESSENNMHKDIEKSKVEEETESFNIEEVETVTNSRQEVPIEKTINDTVKPCTSNSNRRSSPCSTIKKSLKSEKFQNSFFMNILKEKQLVNNIPQGLIESEISKPDVKTSINLPMDNCQNVNIINRETSELEKQIPTPSNSKEALIKLQEIFPDLNDIDLSVVCLLPDNLQREAKKYLKSKQVNDSGKAKNKEVKKVPNDKNGKTKQRSSIENFFIKTDINNYSSENLKQCPQCDQLIPINKFEEHNDFHIARNLQAEMNRISNTDESRKRKVNLESPKQLKKSPKHESANNSPKDKSISSFFQ